jgi:hypothetical protein
VGTLQPVGCDGPMSCLMPYDVFCGAIWMCTALCVLCDTSGGGGCLSYLGWRRQMPKSVGLEIGVWFGIHSAVHHTWSINGVVLCY